MGAVVAKIIFKSGEEQIMPCTRDLLDIEMNDIDGQLVRVGDLIADKKVVLIVNVATK